MKAETQAIRERNKLVADVTDKICKAARLSPTGKYGLEFFDEIMGVYLAGQEAGKQASNEG